MDFTSLLTTHVYTAIVIGSLVEGETTVVLAGFAAHQGYAPWWAVTVVAGLVNFLWDQAYFALGRCRGDRVLEKLPRLKDGVLRMYPLILRHRRWITFGVRFMYGLRTAGPLALGMARVPWSEFLIFNALGAAVWAIVFSTLGYVFGKAISNLIGQIVHYEAQVAIAILAAGVAVLVVRIGRTRNKTRRFMDELEAQLSALLVATSDYGDDELPQALSGVLRVLREQLNMDVVFVSKIAEGRRTFMAVDAVPVHQDLIRPGTSDPLEQSWCHNIVQGRLPELIHNGRPFIESGQAPYTPLEIGTHLSVPVLRADGTVYGTLCTFAFHVENAVDDGDVRRLRNIAQLISTRLPKT